LSRGEPVPGVYFLRRAHRAADRGGDRSASRRRHIARAMQIRENWTDLEGEVVDVRRSGAREGFVELDIAVRAARSVEGFANFFADRVGTTVTVSIRADAAG